VNKDFKSSAYYTFALYGAVGVQLAASVVAGLVVGNYLDGKLQTGPWLAVVGTILGTVGGIWNLIKIMKREERRTKDDE
jgi:F0F1-type ATP synthase assembly protein I